MTSRSTWKQWERRVAALFGTTRTPLSGGASRHTRSDSLSDQVFVEVKYRKSFSIFKLFAEVEKMAAAEGKVPVVALVQKRTSGILFVVRPEDMKKVSEEIV